MLSATVGREPRCVLLSPALRLPTDEALGFEAAVAALGLKANVSEADHPLLCEGTRRQRLPFDISFINTNTQFFYISANLVKPSFNPSQWNIIRKNWEGIK